jgi:hypothetical protein
LIFAARAFLEEECFVLERNRAIQKINSAMCGLLEMEIFFKKKKYPPLGPIYFNAFAKRRPSNQK